MELLALEVFVRTGCPPSQKEPSVYKQFTITRVVVGTKFVIGFAAVVGVIPPSDTVVKVLVNIKPVAGITTTKA